jgi:hypothetical protein
MAWQKEEIRMLLIFSSISLTRASNFRAILDTRRVCNFVSLQQQQPNVSLSISALPLRDLFFLSVLCAGCDFLELSVKNFFPPHCGLV